MNTSLRPIATAFVMAFLWNAITSSAQSITTDTALSMPKVVLVELFTSEGCSDCPPADELLMKINRKQTKSGQLIVGISEHVTYWNSLGWADPFSLEIYNQRQNAYGSKFGLDSVYTPQMIVNGSEQFVGSSSAKLSDALHKEDEQPSTVTVHIVSSIIANGSLNLTYSASGEFPSQGIDIIAILADDSDRSSVQRGENSGRKLTHVSVARSLNRVAELKAPTQATAQLALPPSYQGSQAHHLILLAQTAGYGRILGADAKPF